MSFKSSIGRERSRKRRRMVLRGGLWLAAAAVFAAIGYSSHLTGSMLARQEVSGLEAEKQRLEARLQNERADADRLRLELSQTREANDGLKRRYDANVPSGGLATLVGLVKDRLGAGVKEARLAQVIREAEAARPCEERVVRKRFPIADGSVSFLDGLVQVTTSAPAGPDDPVKTASVTVVRMWSAQPLRSTGLPAHHTIAIANAELKLSVEASDLRGYGTASLSVCGKG